MNDQQIPIAVNPIPQKVRFELDKNFTYHAPKPGQPEIYTQLRKAMKDAAELVCHLCPASRERSVALTKLEEAMFWANASVAREGFIGLAVGSPVEAPNAEIEKKMVDLSHLIDRLPPAASTSNV